MGVFEEVFEYIDWGAKEKGEPPPYSDVMFCWHEGQFPVALKKLRNWRGERRGVFYKLWLYRFKNKSVLAVTKHKKESQDVKKTSRNVDPNTAALLATNRERAK